MKIAHLSMSTLPTTVGGLEVVVDRLAQHQVSAGHDVTVVTRWQQWKALREFGVPYEALGLLPFKALSKQPFRSVGPKFPLAASVYWHQLRHRFDVWHIHWLYPTGWMANDVLKGMGVPVVMTAHGADLQVDLSTGYGYRQFPKHDRRVRRLVPEIDTLTAISETIAEELVRLGADPSRVHRIANGVDATRIGAMLDRREAIRSELGIAKDTTLVISVGRNEPRKGFHFIPETLARLRDDGRKVIWLMIGQETASLAPQLEDKGVSDLARLLPPIRGDVAEGKFPPDELAGIFVASDIFAFPSMSEGLPLVSIEAMAAATPIVGNDVPGIRDMVDDGINGLLCEPGNPAAMAKAIGKVIDDPALARRLGEAGIEKARAHDWSIIAEQYLDLYETLSGRS